MKHSQPPRDHPHWLQPRYRLRVLVADPSLPFLQDHVEQHRWFAEVQLRHDLATDRLHVAEVCMKALGDALLDVDAWRSFPMAKLETAVNVDYLRRLLLRHRADVDPGDDETLTEEARAEAQRRPLPMGKLPATPPDARRRPDSFYEAVADTYTFHLEYGQPPAKRMSEDWSVPVTTINRWVREARRRELLAPARSQGRPG